MTLKRRITAIEEARANAQRGEAEIERILANATEDDLALAMGRDEAGEVIRAREARLIGNQSNTQTQQG